MARPHAPALVRATGAVAVEEVHGNGAVAETGSVEIVATTETGTVIRLKIETGTETETADVALVRGLARAGVVVVVVAAAKKGGPTAQSGEP